MNGASQGEGESLHRALTQQTQQTQQIQPKIAIHKSRHALLTEEAQVHACTGEGAVWSKHDKKMHTC